MAFVSFRSTSGPLSPSVIKKMIGSCSKSHRSGGTYSRIDSRRQLADEFFCLDASCLRRDASVPADCDAYAPPVQSCSHAVDCTLPLSPNDEADQHVITQRISGTEPLHCRESDSANCTLT